MREIVPVDGVEQLAAFVDQAARERLVGLLAVPRTTVGGAQAGHGAAEVFDGGHNGKLPTEHTEHTEKTTNFLLCVPCVQCVPWA